MPKEKELPPGVEMVTVQIPVFTHPGFERPRTHQVYAALTSRGQSEVVWRMYHACYLMRDKKTKLSMQQTIRNVLDAIKEAL